MSSPVVPNQDTGNTCGSRLDEEDTAHEMYNLLQHPLSNAKYNFRSILILHEDLIIIVLVFTTIKLSGFFFIRQYYQHALTVALVIILCT